MARVLARGIGHLGIIGEVARATVDHPAGIAAGAKGQIVALEQRHPQAAHGGVARHAGAVDATANHHHIDIGAGVGKAALGALARLLAA